MNDELWRRDEPDSPCVRVCVVNPVSGLCLGCLRSIDEIAAWSGMTVAERRAVLAELPSRTAQPARRRGGRAGRVGSP